jgi:hypothetical protein
MVTNDFSIYFLRVYFLSLKGVGLKSNGTGAPKPLRTREFSYSCSYFLLFIYYRDLIFKRQRLRQVA